MSVKYNIVERGRPGDPSVRSQSMGIDEREKVSGSQFVNLMSRYHAGKEFKKALSVVKFVKG